MVLSNCLGTCHFVLFVATQTLAWMSYRRTKTAMVLMPFKTKLPSHLCREESADLTQQLHAMLGKRNQKCKKNKGRGVMGILVVQGTSVAFIIGDLTQSNFFSLSLKVRIRSSMVGWMWLKRE